jgi:hypothetical protein
MGSNRGPSQKRYVTVHEFRSSVGVAGRVRIRVEMGNEKGCDAD